MATIAASARAVEAESELARWLGADLHDLRVDLARTTPIWAGPEPDHRVEGDFWHTLSGARIADYNAAGTWSAQPERVDDCRALLEEAGLPGYVLVAGAALGAVRPLADAGWRCAAATRFMARPLGPGPVEDEAVVRVGAEGVTRLRELVEETFSLSSRAGLLSVPESLGGAGAGYAGVRFEPWALVLEGEIVSGLLMAVIGESAVLWSMATSPRLHKRGYGRRLLTTVLARLHAEGTRRSVLIATPAGERLYRSIGYFPFDYWQCWTKARYLPPQ